MNPKDRNNLNPTIPWYQNIGIILSWMWAGISGLALLLSNLDILIQWVTWKVTIIGSILIIGSIIGIQIYLHNNPTKWRNSETDRNRYYYSFDAKTIFTAIGFLIALWIPRVGDLYIPPKSPTTDIRIAVTNFVILDNNIPNSISQEISQEIAISIEDGIREVESDYGKLEIETIPPSRTPAIYGNTASEIEKNAQALAETTDADIVIYGILSKDNISNSIEIEPLFYLTENSAFGFPEFIGQDSWGSKITYPLDNGPQSSRLRDNAREKISNSTKALAYSIYGVWKYSDGQYATSADLFEKAIENTDLNDSQALAVWYLWRGNATLKLGDKDDTDYANTYKYYQASLSYRNGYARAYIGLAETTFSQANSYATQGLNNLDEFVNTTEFLLDQALQAPDRPTSADIDMKAEFIYGRIAQMKYYTNSSSPHNPVWLNEAEAHYQNVIHTFRGGNSRITEQAGLSYMLLGEINKERKEFDLAFSNFTLALDILQDPSAIELTRSSLAQLPVPQMPPIRAQAELATAIALSNNENHKLLYENRMDCLTALPTPFPQDRLRCP